MGKALYESSSLARDYFEKANDILDFRITDLMFNGSEEDLLQTKVTQPAVYLHSVITAICSEEGIAADMVAGHSLGEFSALTVAGALTFEDGLRLVAKRADAMQKACKLTPSSMMAVMGSDLSEVETVCASITEEVVVAANFNHLGQISISGTVRGLEIAAQKLKAMQGKVKRVLPLNVSGAFHSPLMEPAREELEKAIMATPIAIPSCPVYQNVDALPHTKPEEIKANLMAQLTSPVRWTQSVLNMLADGAAEFIEIGPSTPLTGMIAKIKLSLQA